MKTLFWERTLLVDNLWCSLLSPFTLIIHCHNYHTEKYWKRKWSTCSSIDLNDVFQEAGGKVEEWTRNFLVILTIRVQQPGIEEIRNQIFLPKLHLLSIDAIVPKVYNKNNLLQKFPFLLGFRFGQLLWFVCKPVHLMAGLTAVAEEFVVFCYNRHCPRPQGGCWGQWWHCAVSEKYLVIWRLSIRWRNQRFLENYQQKTKNGSW